MNGLKDWQHDQVGEDKGDRASEADPAVPEHGRERDVADRADEGTNGDERTDDRAPEGGDARRANVVADPGSGATAPSVSTSGLGPPPRVIRLRREAKFRLRADARETIVADPICMKTTRVSPVIVVESLTKRYGTLRAVDDLSFSARAGAVTGFLGPNGAGKTTALKMIAGLARPTAGRALVNGSAVASATADADRLGVYIEPCGAHPGRSGRNHLRALAAMAGLPRSRVDEVLALVGLEQAAGRRVGTYSMGMRQRLGLAAALLGDPQILVLDEPLNGLDPLGIRWLRTFLRERASGGGTVLLSSHVLSEAAQTVDDIVVIHKGRLVRHGPIDELVKLGGGGVLVSTPTRERLATAVQAAGGRVEFLEGAARLAIEGLDAARVGDLAHDERVVLHELAPRAGSLEEVFFNLTEEEQPNAPVKRLWRGRSDRAGGS
jgi:ABC-2 type transport system ATP-binding protein